MDHDFFVAIPVFNEAKYLIPVLEQVREFARDILVIDDGSTDATPDLLKQVPGIHVITHPENRGYGKSLADAFEFAMAHGAEWLITMDCDEQHEPACIPRFLQAAVTGQADIISGTRYPGGTGANSSAPADRRAINATITDRLNRRLGLCITDAFCGFKAYRVASLPNIKITVPGYAMPMQFWVQAVHAGLRITELPVRLIYNDPTRHFGGMLDDPTVRLAHYLDVLDQELSAANDTLGECRLRRVPCSSR